MLPLFLKVTDRLCLVVGGGAVGQRKLAALLDAGARVRLVCLESQPADLTAPTLDWLQQPYCPEHLEGVSLVIAAATPAVNRQIVHDAQDRGLWVNAATDPQQGDVFLPAVLRRGDLVIAVGTHGQAPGLARQVRTLLDDHLDESFAQWLELLKELRRRVLDVVADAERRPVLLEYFCRWHWLERLRHEDAAVVRAAMFAELQRLVTPHAP